LKPGEELLLQSVERYSISINEPHDVGFHMQWRNQMTTFKILSAALIAGAMIATPAMARTSHVASRHLAADTSASASTTARYPDGRVCIPAPRVGAFATAPWTGNNIPCEPESY
jgi:hypothetical protein